MNIQELITIFRLPSEQQNIFKTSILKKRNPVETSKEIQFKRQKRSISLGSCWDRLDLGQCQCRGCKEGFQVEMGHADNQAGLVAGCLMPGCLDQESYIWMLNAWMLGCLNQESYIWMINALMFEAGIIPLDAKCLVHTTYCDLCLHA